MRDRFAEGEATDEGWRVSTATQAYARKPIIPTAVEGEGLNGARLDIRKSYRRQ